MCTVSFLPISEGFFLAMNRDEQRTRVEALPPSVHESNYPALYPSEPNGGTWIGINSKGLTFALINWYQKMSPAPPQSTASRGEIIPLLLQGSLLSQADEYLKRALPLSSRLPFRLIGLSMGEALEQLVEWQWDGSHLERLSHPWARRHWFSSGYDEPGAAHIRAHTAEMFSFGEPPNLESLRKLHASHIPETGPYSICMHREDGQTVSFTGITVTSTHAEMLYQPGSPCQAITGNLKTLSISK